VCGGRHAGLSTARPLKGQLGVVRASSLCTHPCTPFKQQQARCTWTWFTAQQAQVDQALLQAVDLLLVAALVWTSASLVPGLEAAARSAHSACSPSPLPLAGPPGQRAVDDWSRTTGATHALRHVVVYYLRVCSRPTTSKHHPGCALRSLLLLSTWLDVDEWVLDCAICVLGGWLGGDGSIDTRITTSISHRRLMATASLATVLDNKPVL
jgi:hypothetical protein